MRTKTLLIETRCPDCAKRVAWDSFGAHKDGKSIELTAWCDHCKQHVPFKIAQK